MSAGECRRCGSSGTTEYMQRGAVKAKCTTCGNGWTVRRLTTTPPMPSEPFTPTGSFARTGGLYQ